MKSIAKIIWNLWVLPPLANYWPSGAWERRLKALQSSSGRRCFLQHSRHKFDEVGQLQKQGERPHVNREYVQITLIRWKANNIYNVFITIYPGFYSKQPWLEVFSRSKNYYSSLHLAPVHHMKKAFGNISTWQKNALWEMHHEPS